MDMSMMLPLCALLLVVAAEAVVPLGRVIKFSDRAGLLLLWHLAQQSVRQAMFQSARLHRTLSCHTTGYVSDCFKLFHIRH